MKHQNKRIIKSTINWKKHTPRWWFQTCFNFHPLGKMNPIWRKRMFFIVFPDGLVQPPTNHQADTLSKTRKSWSCIKATPSACKAYVPSTVANVGPLKRQRLETAVALLWQAPMDFWDSFWHSFSDVLAEIRSDISSDILSDIGRPAVWRLMSSFYWVFFRRSCARSTPKSCRSAEDIRCGSQFPTVLFWPWFAGKGDR